MSSALTFAVIGALIAGTIHVAFLVIRGLFRIAARAVDGFQEGFRDTLEAIEEPHMIPARTRRQPPSPRLEEEDWCVPRTASYDQMASCLARAYAAHIQGVAYWPTTALDEAICERGVEIEALVRVHGGYRFASDYALGCAKWCWERQRGHKVGQNGAGAHGGQAPSIQVQINGPVLIQIRD